MMNRRKLLAALGLCALAAPFAAFAQQRGGMPRIGFLISETLSGQASRVEALRTGLRDLGYVEGKNVAIEFRPADGNYDRLPELAGELVRLKVDVRVAFGGKAVSAAKRATTTIPIVVPASSDLVAVGLVSSLARPAGNITGSALFGPEAAAKRMELLKEAVPRITRVAALLNPANESSRPLTLQPLRAAARSLKLELQAFELRAPKEFGGAFSAMAKGRVDAIVVQQDTLFRAHAGAIADLAAKQRLASAGNKEFAEAGGLIGYGVTDADLYRRGAYFVDRILKGAKPSELPVEQPTTLELVINMKTAKALGLSLSSEILLRADRVIE